MVVTLTPADQSDSASLPALSQRDLDQRAAEITAHWRVAVSALWHIGRVLADTKERLEHGRFIQWVADAVPFSLSYVQRCIQIYRNMPSDGAYDRFDTAALMLLAQDNTPPDARAAVLAAAGNGKVIDHATAYIMVKAPLPIQRRVEEGDLAPRAAYAITKEIEKAPPVIQQVALEHNVSQPQVVQYLTDSYTRSGGNSDAGWRDVAHHGGFLMGDDSYIPLREATAETVDRYNQGRAWQHANQKSRKRLILSDIPARVDADNRITVEMDGNFIGETVYVSVHVKDVEHDR